MEKKREAVKLIQDKMNGKTFLSYKEIAVITGYHPKYILKFITEAFKCHVSYTSISHQSARLSCLSSLYDCPH